MRLQTIRPGGHPCHNAYQALVQIGGADGIADPVAGKEFFDAATSKDKQHKQYDGLLHELFHEPERETVFRDVVGWLDERARGASARAAGAR